MKKVYKKPVLYFENFELSTSIATGCGHPIHNQSKDVCGLDMGGGIIVFLNGISGCTGYQLDNDNYNGLCYHNPSDTQNLFNSQ